MVSFSRIAHEILACLLLTDPARSLLTPESMAWLFPLTSRSTVTEVAVSVVAVGATVAVCYFPASWPGHPTLVSVMRILVVLLLSLLGLHLRSSGLNSGLQLHAGVLVVFLIVGWLMGLYRRVVLVPLVALVCSMGLNVLSQSSQHNKTEAGPEGDSSYYYGLARAGIIVVHFLLFDVFWVASESRAVSWRNKWIKLSQRNTAIEKEGERLSSRLSVCVADLQKERHGLNASRDRLVAMSDRLEQRDTELQATRQDLQRSEKAKRATQAQAEKAASSLSVRSQELRASRQAFVQSESERRAAETQAAIAERKIAVQEQELRRVRERFQVVSSRYLKLEEDYEALMESRRIIQALDEVSTGFVPPAVVTDFELTGRDEQELKAYILREILDSEESDEFKQIIRTTGLCRSRLYTWKRRARIPEGKGDLPEICVFKFMFNSSADLIVTEFEALRRIRHPNIVRVFKFSTASGTRGLVMEQLHLAVTDLILQRSLTFRNKLKIAMGVVKAMCRVHASGVKHLDLNWSNVMVSHPLEDERWRSVVIDFEQSWLKVNAFGPTISRSSFGGTPGYTAPEVFKPALGVVGKSADVFAFGIMLFELFYDVVPYYQDWPEARDFQSSSDLFKCRLGHLLAMKNKRPKLGRMPLEAVENAKSWQRELHKVMKKCWNSNPSKRGDFGELKICLEELNRVNRGR